MVGSGFTMKYGIRFNEDGRKVGGVPCARAPNNSSTLNGFVETFPEKVLVSFSNFPSNSDLGGVLN